MSDYKPIPVSVAVQIAESFEKSMVVIMAYDPKHERSHTTTYGQNPADKENAAKIGDACSVLVCGEEGFAAKRSYEDYRFVDQGKRAEENRRLKSAIAELVESFDGCCPENIESGLFARLHRYS